MQVYGAKKIWRKLNREGVAVARCKVERLMNAMGIQSAVRGGVKCWTTVSDKKPDRPSDLVNRQFVADRPNQLWVADITL